MFIIDYVIDSIAYIVDFIVNSILGAFLPSSVSNFVTVVQVLDDPIPFLKACYFIFIIVYIILIVYNRKIKTVVFSVFSIIRITPCTYIFFSIVHIFQHGNLFNAVVAVFMGGFCLLICLIITGANEVGTYHISMELKVLGTILLNVIDTIALTLIIMGVHSIFA